MKMRIADLRLAVVGIALCGAAPGVWAQGGVKTVAAALPSAGSAMPAIAPDGTKIFPLAEIHRGLHAVAYTVFEGVVPEPMEVEILGVLKDAIGPGQDMILARLKGEKPEYTGVVAGMSGSPVYVDGRLVGALSYRIGQFSKEPIAGITPIEQMLEVKDAGVVRMQVAAGGDKSSLLRVAQNRNDRGVLAAVGGNGVVTPIETALVFGGFSQAAVDRFGGEFKALGMTPVAGLGGAAAAGTRQPEPIVPGSAVSAVMVRGDLSISGTCTVTYVDKNQLLACGHPLTQFGRVAMPMTKAEVVATLASPLNAFKIINTTETVGEFTEDRASAIYGRFGAEARMIPVSVEVVSGSSSSPTHRDESTMTGTARLRAGGMQFEVLDNRQLTPSAMLVSIYQSLDGTNASSADMSFRMTGELTVKGQPPVKLEGMMSPSDSGSGAVAAALYVNDRFSRLYGNAVEQPEVTGLKLRMESIPERRTAVLEGARLGRTEVHAGQTLEVEATVHPYQSEAKVVRLQVKLPDTLTPGPMRIVVSDGASLDRLTTPATAAGHPVALADAVAQINRSHANDRVYVTLLDRAPQAAMDTQALPDVPLSMANVLEPLKAVQKVQLTGESAVEVGSAGVGYALSGTQVLMLDVR